jgi:hypothetical protein
MRSCKPKMNVPKFYTKHKLKTLFNQDQKMTKKGLYKLLNIYLYLKIPTYLLFKSNLETFIVF